MLKDFDPRPRRLPGYTERLDVEAGHLYVTISEDQGRPREVFVVLGKAGSLQRGTGEALGRLISLALKHDVPSDLIVEQLLGIKEMDPTWNLIDGESVEVWGLSDGIAQVLKRWQSVNPAPLMSVDQDGEVSIVQEESPIVEEDKTTITPADVVLLGTGGSGLTLRDHVLCKENFARLINAGEIAIDDMGIGDIVIDDSANEWVFKEKPATFQFQGRHDLPDPASCDHRWEYVPALANLSKSRRCRYCKLIEAEDPDHPFIESEDDDESP